MFGGIDPKKMQAMMKQMGIKQEEIDAERVIIEGNDKRIIIDNPSVVKVVMQGQESFQISGDVREEEESGFNEDDIKMVMEKTGKGEDEVKEALAETNDIAEAIVKLSS